VNCDFDLTNILCEFGVFKIAILKLNSLIGNCH